MKSSLVLAALYLMVANAGAAALSDVPSRILSVLNSNDTVTLSGNTHPGATTTADQGPVDGHTSIRHLFIVLQRSSAQEAALDAFNSRQYDTTSADYHRWLQPEEFGRAYGPSDADIVGITTWLKGSGLNVDHISAGRIAIECSGTVEQVQKAFNVQMHRYLINGAVQIANDRDPQIPRALSQVVSGVSGLNDFPIKSSVVPGAVDAQRDASGRMAAYLQPSPTRVTATDPTPDYTVGYLGFVYEFMTPYDFAKIYNSLPLWNASKPIIGSGVRIAVVGENDVNLNDVATYRSSFGLPANTPTIQYVGAKPEGTSVDNTAELELVGAAAPGADIELIVPENGSFSGGTVGNGGITTGGFLSAINYIVEQNKVNIVTSGYALCELLLGASSNKLINQVWQEGAASGMSIFAATGSVGSAGCASGTYHDVDTYGLQVSGIASSQFVTAVGATDFAWNWLSGGVTTYWNTTGTNNGNDAHHASAKSYIPEYPWNVSCANVLYQEGYFFIDGAPQYPYPIDICAAYANDPEYSGILIVQGGGGGASSCGLTNNSGTCAGYGKPAWQTGTGVPADKVRDVPDVALFASAGWPAARDYFGVIPPGESFISGTEVLTCYSGTINGVSHACTYSGTGDYSDIIYQGQGGTALASAYWAGIMAMVEQKAGGARQGLANPALYKLWGQESNKLIPCDTLNITADSTCVFYDIAAAISNAQPCAGTIATGDSHPDCTYTAPNSALQFKYGILNGYQASIGYDQTSGLGSVNITNLVNSWSSSAPTPTVMLSATSLAFGSIAVGSTSGSQPLTIKNSGSVAVAINSGGIALTGQADDFLLLTNGCGSSLAVGASCTLTVGFKPISTGGKAAAISIADNASGSPQTVALTGTGSTAGSAPAIKLSVTTLAFGNQKAGSESAAKTVTLSNSGKATLALASITVTGQSDDFVLTKGCGSSLGAGASCTLAVGFKPISTGGKAAAISIADNASGSPQTVALTGAGTTAGSVPAVKLSVTTLAFGNQKAGSESATKSVTLTNTGTASLALASITVTGQSDDFVLTNACGTSLGAGASCALKVVFKPVSAGKKVAAISIADNASGSPQAVTLSGSGT